MLLAGQIHQEHKKDYKAALRWYSKLAEQKPDDELDKIDVKEAVSKLKSIYEYNLKDEVMMKPWEEKLRN